MPNKTTARWTLKSQDGIESLHYEEKAELPELGEENVLVEIHAASLNYRDLAIAKVYNSFLKQPFSLANFYNTFPQFYIAYVLLPKFRVENTPVYTTSSQVSSSMYPF
jgi:hypothetical protein